MTPSPPWLLLLLLVPLVTVVSVQAQGIVFNPDGRSSSTCTSRSGDPGRWINITSCPSVIEGLRLRPPVIPVTLRVEGRFPIVCCPSTGTNGPGGQVLDVSPPNIDFECGLSKPGQFFFPNGERLTSGNVLRPGHELPFSRASLGMFERQVVGGETAEINAWPWMALIGQKRVPENNWFCAGVLINKQWILSAAHCFTSLEANVVRLGEHDYNSDNDGVNPVDFDVAQIILYPDYVAHQAYHDLALLKLATRVSITRTIRPACLPWGRDIQTDLTGSRVVLAGWGTTVFGGLPSSTLQDVMVEVFPSSRCAQSYSNLPEYPTTWPQGIGKETLCAGEDGGGRDACQGDSGGPLVSTLQGRYTVAGIVSRGYGCAHEDYPGLYANLRHSPYLAWIKKTAF